MAETKLFAKQLHIKVRGKIATLESKNFELVGGNNDYSVVFDFDEPWQAETTKTAIFTFGHYPVFKVFDGNICDGVVITDATACYIGVFAGNLITTTPALIKDIRLSISDVSNGTPAPPEEDVYNQIMALINKYISQGGGGGGVSFITDETLSLKLNEEGENVLSVNVSTEPDPDNTLPITSAAVATTVGNIEILLQTI